MSHNSFKKVLIVCLCAFILAILSIVLGAGYLLNYKPDTSGKEEDKTYVVTDEHGNKTVIKIENSDDNYNFLVLGHDRVATLTDVIILVNYNVAESRVTMMQFPRDSFVSYGVPTSKINATYGSLYSKALGEGQDQKKARVTALRGFADVLEEGLGINIYKCAIMDLDGFANIVDALGGVEIDVPFDMYYNDTAQNLYINLRAGRQTLNGAQSEQFVRFRYGLLQGDMGRENMQKIFMSAFIKQAKNSISLSNISMLTEIATEVINNLDTDFTVSDVVYFAKEILGKVDLSQIRLLSVPGSSMTGSNGGSYYVINRPLLFNVVNKYFNTLKTDIPNELFDSKKFFTDLNSSAFTDAYYSTELPEFSEEFTVQDVNDSSINIPTY